MIILYVPYIRANSGDLNYLVTQWKLNCSENSREPINIIYHKGEFELDPEFESYEIYICVHGDKDNVFLGNQENFIKAEIIDIQTVADRFNQDFMFVFNSINKIHLYCCGYKEKNRYLAQELQSHLLRPDHCNITFYSGRVTIPDKTGKQWSCEFDSPNIFYAQDVATHIYRVGVDDYPKREDIKRQTISQFLADAPIKRREGFFNRVGESRTQKMSLLRNSDGFNGP